MRSLISLTLFPFLPGVVSFGCTRKRRWRIQNSSEIISSCAGCCLLRRRRHVNRKEYSLKNELGTGQSLLHSRPCLVGQARCKLSTRQEGLVLHHDLTCGIRPDWSFVVCFCFPESFFGVPRASTFGLQSQSRVITTQPHYGKQC